MLDSSAAVTAAILFGAINAIGPSHVAAWSTTSSVASLTSLPTRGTYRSTMNSMGGQLMYSRATSLRMSLDTSTLDLTPELEMMTQAFSTIPDEKTRHKQLLYMSSKLPAVDDSVRVPENKVPGCLSTVHVDCDATLDEDRGVYLINFVGDSDGLLTKGLLAMLVRGLSGSTADEINKVSPDFMTAAKLSQSLTPGRNNGFLNMLATMKRKSLEAEKSTSSIGATDSSQIEAAEEETTSLSQEIEGNPIYNAVMGTLTAILKPESISLVEDAGEHIGENRFALEIVSDAFEGLSPEQRHKLIYMLLNDVMPEIDELKINSMVPSEVQN